MGDVWAEAGSAGVGTHGQAGLHLLGAAGHVLSTCGVSGTVRNMRRMLLSGQTR